MTKRIIDLTNKYLADIAVSYIKIHNLHWNVVGPQFKAVHEYLESIYDGYSEKLDEVAELIRMNGAFPAASLKEYLELSDISELDSKEIKVEDAVKELLKNISSLRDEAAAIRKDASEEDAFSLVNVLEDHISGYEKNIWFIESMLK
ncbi:MAG: DNA starvation/stationary phase protection protein [Lachnospiraceae bacterium]|nr:DNA starvation/stationary phase protection protein [Lachnospiraceae bacterium]